MNQYIRSRTMNRTICNATERDETLFTCFRTYELKYKATRSPLIHFSNTTVNREAIVSCMRIREHLGCGNLQCMGFHMIFQLFSLNLAYRSRGIQHTLLRSTQLKFTTRSWLLALGWFRAFVKFISFSVSPEFASLSFARITMYSFICKQRDSLLYNTQQRVDTYIDFLWFDVVFWVCVSVHVSCWLCFFSLLQIKIGYFIYLFFCFLYLLHYSKFEPSLVGYMHFQGPAEIIVSAFEFPSIGMNLLKDLFSIQHKKINEISTA